MESAGLFGTVCNTAGINEVSRFVWYTVQYSKVLMKLAGLFGTVCNTARY